MKEILRNAQTFKFTSLKYIDIDGIEMNPEEDVFINGNDAMILCNKAGDDYLILWAAKTREAFMDAIQELTLKMNDLITKKPRRLYMEFVDPQFVGILEDIGFVIVSQFIDFWLEDIVSCNCNLKNDVLVRSAKAEDYVDVSYTTKLCKDQSRGFHGEDEEFIKDWDEEAHSCILIAEVRGQMAGVCLTRIYGFDSEKGPVLWIRQLAVNPMYQSQGIGSRLVEHSLHWGKNHGAKRSFLAVDKDNRIAMNLYTKFGFRCKDEVGQINMALYCNPGGNHE